MILYLTIIAMLLTLTLLVGLIRVIIGPSESDRMLACQLFGTAGYCNAAAGDCVQVPFTYTSSTIGRSRAYYVKPSSIFGPYPYHNGRLHALDWRLFSRRRISGRCINCWGRYFDFYKRSISGEYAKFCVSRFAQHWAMYFYPFRFCRGAADWSVFRIPTTIRQCHYLIY